MGKGRKGKFTAVVLAASVVLAACGSGGQSQSSAAGGADQTKNVETEAPATKTEQAKTEAAGEKEAGRDAIVAAVSSDIKSMDPATGVDAPSALLSRHVYNGLVRIDENKQVVGDLAESFELVDDVTYRFKLKEGVKFHNGEELKASDVKFTLERCKTMPKAMSNASAIDNVSVEGDYDLTIHLSRPYPSLLYILNDTSMKILSEKAVTEAGEAYGENPIGTGPFVFKEIGRAHV